MSVRYVGSTANKQTGKATKPTKADRRAAKSAAKAADKAASQVNGKVGKADRLAAARAAAAAKTDAVASSRFFKRDEKKSDDRAWDKPTYAPGEEPSKWDVSEWSLRRKVALVLALPVIVAAVFGGLRINSERQLASNYAASSSQVTVLEPAINYLTTASRAAVIAREVGINDPKLEAAKREVVEAGTKLIEARDRADLTPTQLRQINDVIALSEQMRSGMAYVSLGSSVSQIRQLERGITQMIATIIDAQTTPEPKLQVLAQVLDGRLSLALQDIRVANYKDIDINPADFYSEFGVELGIIDRLAVALGQTDPRVLEIRQANAQRVVNADEGIKITPASYDAYDGLIDDLLVDIDENLSTAARNAKVLTWVDSIIIGSALLAAILLALLVSRLILNPIRRVRSGALQVAHERLPEAVAKIRAGEDPGEIVPIGVTTHEETGQLARAVDDLHRQAVKLASNEAFLREQVGDMFVTLSRRNTSLINQQLSLIETLESDEEDPQRLESLFRLDHLASRMRRNAESLVILSGAPTRASEQDDLSLTDVLQAAIAGVQDYKRVQLDAAPAQRVSGEAAPDVVHLLAELVDNALSYSPPSSRVLVTSSFTRGGVVVQVTDAGLGIAEDALAEANDKLRSGGEVTPDTARRMGLFVVSRLAQRHGLTVQLDHNDRMGITATVFLPTSVLSDTARLEAGPGGAQVIELGAATAEQGAYTDYAEYADYTGDDETTEQEADVVAFRSEPEPAPEPEEFDPITAAINAYGLPQRRPGATGAGQSGAPVSMGGGFFDRVEPDQELPELPAPAAHEDVVEAVVAEDEERAPIALGPVNDETDDEEADAPEADAEDENRAAEMDADVEVETDVEAAADETDTDEAAEETDSEEADDSEVADEAETDAEVTEQVAEVDETDVGDVDEADGAETGEEPLAPVAALPLPSTEPFEPPAADAHGNGNGNGKAASLAARLHSLAAAARNGSEAQDAAVAASVTPAGDAGDVPTNGAPDELAGLPAAWTSKGDADDVREPASDSPLDGPLPLGATGSARTPATMDEDETPIFRSLRSNWLSSDTGERPWADTEVDAGWDAAGRVEATPPTRRTETGLPMRRPGNRLIPGGISAPAPVQTVRDPEAIRARLAAHAAGVSRGRNAAVSSPSTQEADPA